MMLRITTEIIMLMMGLVMAGGRLMKHDKDDKTI